VLIDGAPDHACQRRVSDVASREVTTIESLARAGALHIVQQAFVEIGAAQCGYCTPGMVLSVVALLARDSNPDDATIDDALNGNICRCGTYPRIRRAVHRARSWWRSRHRTIGRHSGDGPLGTRGSAESAASPSRPWDLTEPEDRDWFEVLGDGLVVVLPTPPLAPGSWTTGASAWLHVDADAKVTAFTGKSMSDRTTARRYVSWSPRNCVFPWRTSDWRWGTPISAPTTWEPSGAVRCPTPVTRSPRRRPTRGPCCRCELVCARSKSSLANQLSWRAPSGIWPARRTCPKE